MQYVRILAEVPKNPLGLESPIRFADVFSISGSNKKKSSEIAVGVDGHSIGIYDVRSGSIITSYAISPTSTLTCPPCAIKLKKSAAREAQRSTYCSVSDPQPKIVRFLEDNQNPLSRGGQLKTSAFALPKNSSPIVLIEALANAYDESQAPSIDIFCFHEDGQIRCYDEALQSEKWSTQIASARDAEFEAEKLQLVCAVTVGTQQAMKTILKNRDDLVKILDANQDIYFPSLLLALTRSAPDSVPKGQETLTFRILAIQRTHETAPGVFLGNKNPIVELASLALPEPLVARGEDTGFKMHPMSGLLYQEMTGNLIIYDLTAIAPRVIQTTNFSYAKAGMSYLRISPNIIATSSRDAVFLIDTKFSSFQATYGLPIPKQARSRISNHSNSKSSNDVKAGVQLQTYHSPSSSAILLFGRTLMAVDLSAVTAGKSVSKKRTRDGLLIDAIGRGSLSAERSKDSKTHMTGLPRALGQIMDPCEENPMWEFRRESLDALLEKGDFLEYDRMATSTLQDENFVSSHGAATTRPLQFMVDYLLGKAFSTTISDQTTQSEDGSFLSELHLQHLPARAWQYLVHKGLISTERLEISLKLENAMHQNNALRNTGLIQVLANYDTTMATILLLLQSPCLLKISEVCHALKICTAKFASPAVPNSTKLLIQANEHPGPGHESAGQKELEMDNADGRSTQIVESRDRFGDLLDAIIQRCNACPASLLTKALKLQLSIVELRNVVDLLRIKLAQNGWLSFCADNMSTAHDEKRYHDNQISTIVKLLNCIVDGLGTRGWLLNDSVADTSAEAIETISYMKTEICAALEGIEEAAYLQGMLGEILLCGKGALNSHGNRPPPLDWGDKQKRALPLGLKLDRSISLTKVGAGGELQKRSLRDIGKLKSRRVPEYSFERIAV